ncbi:hypothetical protein BDA96_05G091100 [Sorghum bicolor]|uniref:Uncharacterized protein n=1 Tax=Sorghum bicolor TaxID=4558 RepID=A0A921QWT0_SORBI|nr:hypothetical protein BDA96_05G091100 [Sorghum bicolor]
MAKHHLHLIVTLLFVATILTTPGTTSASSSTPPPTATSPPPPTATSPPAAPPPPGSSPAAPRTAYEMLEQYNLSRGILPEGVTGYDLRPDGSFEVYLPGDCSVHVAGGTPIRYSSVIAGNIQSQWIRALKGVKVKVLLTWIAITGVNRTQDDQLNFFAGRISKSFPADKFANSPQCV